MTTYQNYINGQFIDAADTHDVINPSTGQVLAHAPSSDIAAVNEAVAAAKAAQVHWAELPNIERAGYLTAIAAKLRDNVDRFAHYLVEEQGKVQALAEVEVSFTADYFDYMAGWARRLEGEVIPSDRPGEMSSSPTTPLAWWVASCRGTSPSSSSPAKWHRPCSLATPS